MQDPNDPFVGHTLKGKYLLDRIVADGGMGRVYEAKRADGGGDGRRIAVKILHADVGQDAVNVERFKREADTSHALEHPNVVEVFDFDREHPAPGRPEGAWFLVMEYLDGDELRAELDRLKVLPIARSIRIICQAAMALDHAHSKGFVHRDLKPDNLFLVRGPKGDHVKLLDFGSVKFTKGQDRGQKLTVMGTTIGSPFYMSPEQARGAADLDHRADVWALGAMLYEMSVGKVPFLAGNGPQILFKILGEEPPPPSFERDDAPLELDDFMIKALNKDRDKRFQSCGELALALGQAFGLPGTPNDWANMTEAELSSKMGSASPKTAPAAIGPAIVPAVPATNMPPPKPMVVPPPDVVDALPVSKPPVMLYAAVVVVLLIGISIIAAIAMK